MPTKKKWRTMALIIDFKHFLPHVILYNIYLSNTHTPIAKDTLDTKVIRQ